jgi:hypothetical protein
MNTYDESSLGGGRRLRLLLAKQQHQQQQQRKTQNKINNGIPTARPVTNGQSSRAAGKKCKYKIITSYYYLYIFICKIYLSFPLCKEKLRFYEHCKNLHLKTKLICKH